MTHCSSFDLLRRGVLRLRFLLVAWLVGCSNEPPQLVLPLPPSGAGSPPISLGFGGSSASQSDGGGAGAVGVAEEGGQGGQSSGSGGALPVAGASGFGGNCPLSGPGVLSDCDEPKKGSCTSCLCSAPGCASAWSTCQDDSRCVQAAQCVVLGCPSSLCATLAGAAQIKLLPVLECVSLGCAGACAGLSGASGSEAGAGGAAGEGGSGRGGDGEGGNGGGAGEGEGAAGRGDGGEGGAAGSSAAGAAGESGSGGEGGGAGEVGLGGFSVDCEALSEAPLDGACLEVTPTIVCDPFLKGSCGGLDKVCTFHPSVEEASGTVCLSTLEPAALCSPCSLEVPCGAGLACFQGTCARLCCSGEDCGPSGQCSPVAFGAGVCLASP
ncbi:MAG: hypothetical protein RMJ98_12185 [Myxococcales bacterium]|nr:hypothetical protein [Polyangiaceae bacterium]MDW8250046.1 hypothetical protein [Myxococcales bacterium]